MSRAQSSMDRLRQGTVGWEEAAALVRQMLEGDTPIHAGITGPGGAGKSTLLDEIARALRAEGFDVARGLEEHLRAELAGERAALLMDDAEHLDDDDAATIIDLISGGGTHVVVAFRPWPRTAAVAALEDRIGRRQHHVVLQPLSATGVHDRAESLLGDALPHDQVERIIELTSGSPRFVDDVLAAMREDGWNLDEAHSLPSMTLDRLWHRIDHLDRELFEFLVALAVGFSVSGPAFATAPRFAGSDLRELMAAARASGMLSPDGSLLPVVRITILQGMPDHELWPMRRELVDAVQAAGLPLGPTARELARQGFGDPRIAEALSAQADDALPTEPVDAWRLYAASIEAGADMASLAGRRAQAAWAVGDIRAAERLVDGVLTGDEHPDLHRVMNVAAAIWARKGMLRRTADAYVGLTQADVGGSSPLAACCLAMLGDAESSKSILAAAPVVEYPTSSQVALALMADGILMAIDGAPDRARSALLHASSVMNESEETIPLPEVPAVLAAHVALDAGELGIAADVLRSAIEAVQGGPAFRNRLRLTEAIVAMRADRPDRAQALLNAVESSQRPLGLRDEVLAHSVRIGLARRTDDVSSLVRAWNAARQTVGHMPIDLTVLPALAELTIAAARLNETHFIAAPVAAAWALLDGVGSPPCWTTNLHWSGLQAAILRSDRSDLDAHSSALLDAGATNRVARRLAEAGRVWAAALAGDVDVQTVERVVRDLAAVGYPWDASRLAGHAAARAAEHQDTLRLLALARDLRPEASVPDPARPPAAGADVRRDDRRLSPREREVARLVLAGKTYAEIGTAIFISPRTAEHHIARIRRRLGATTRSELLARLRLVLDDPDDTV